MCIPSPPDRGTHIKIAIDEHGIEVSPAVRILFLTKLVGRLFNPRATHIGRVCNHYVISTRQVLEPRQHVERTLVEFLAEQVIRTTNTRLHFGNLPGSVEVVAASQQLSDLRISLQVMQQRVAQRQLEQIRPHCLHPRCFLHFLFRETLPAAGHIHSVARRG